MLLLFGLFFSSVFRVCNSPILLGIFCRSIRFWPYWLDIWFLQNLFLKKIIIFALIFHSLYTLAFLNIYIRPHSRVDASRWIYNNIPSGSRLANEYWDDPLPLGIPEYQTVQYQNIMLPLYDSDTPEKWLSISTTLAQTDYIIMSSNRLWGSIPPVPSRYPLTSVFYQNLFDEKIGFSKLAEFYSYPGFSLPLLKKCYYFGPSNYPYKEKRNTWFSVDKDCLYPGFYFRDDTAEEAFTVYDHPQALIYQRTNL